jgi:hypothetical protein
MPRVVGSGLSIAAAVLLVALVVLADGGLPATLMVTVAMLCQVTAFWRPNVVLRLCAGFWCLATGLLAALAVAGYQHGFNALLIPGTEEAAWDAWGCCPSIKLPELALATLFVFGQLCGALILYDGLSPVSPKPLSR